MSSRTPNDILRHKVSKSSAISKNREKEVTSARLKDVFVNSKQREELMTACSRGDLPKVTHLLEEKKAGLNPDLIRDSKLRTPLLVACAAGQAAVVKQLIRWGADVNNPLGDIVGNKPLDLAVISNSVETVLALLEAGAKITTTKIQDNNDGLPLPTRIRAGSRTPLDLANSRLDLLIKQSKQAYSIKSETMDQVLQIIKLLKHFLTNDTAIDELDELTNKISNMDILDKNDSNDNIFIMESLKDVLSRIY